MSGGTLMSETFSCPTCGGPLKYDGGSEYTVTCPFCGRTVIVPENLRTTHPTKPVDQPAPTDKVDEAEIFQKIQELFRLKKKIEAIKLYRECYPGDLVTAKRVVEGIEAETVTSLPEVEVNSILLEQYQGGSSTNGCGYILLITLVPVAVIVLIIFALNAIFNPYRTSPSSIVSTELIGPSAVPMATQVPRLLKFPKLPSRSFVLAAKAPDQVSSSTSTISPLCKMDQFMLGIVI